MNADSIDRIRSSFSLLQPSMGTVMERFYEKLFASAPAVRPMFPKDMTEQRKHLAAAIGLVVKNADKLSTLEGALMDMGARHVKYGAKPEHYPVVRDVMLETLAEAAGKAWSPQLHDDWAEALNAVAGAMIKGAERVGKAAA